MSILSTTRNIASEVEEKGFCLVPSKDLVVSEAGRLSLQQFLKSWDDLPRDPYMQDGARYRERRYGRFYFASDIETPLPLPNAAFVQSETINSYAGGIERWFEPFHEQTFANPFLLQLISFNFSLLPIPSALLDGAWEIKCQQIRILAERDTPGKPTPEGLHRDGFNYFTLHLMDRRNITGGSSLICDDAGDTLAEFMLEDALDSIYVEDSRVLHGVSPISLDGDVESGSRDVLIVNYEYQPNLSLEIPRRLGNFSR